MVPSALPKRILLPDVPAYVLTAYGHRVSRITVYNWSKVGRRGTKLKLLPDKGRRSGSKGGPPAVLTTNYYVDEFLKATHTRIV